MARLEPELNPGATCWYLMETETTTVSPGRSSRVKRHSRATRAPSRGLPPGSAAFCSGDGDLTGVDELEGKLLLV